MTVAIIGYLSLVISVIFALNLVRKCSRAHDAKQLRYWVVGHAIFLTLSILVLAYAFVNDIWLIAYVSQHSHSTLPLIYKICAVWGGHEGSLLLWVWLLAIWMIVLWFNPGPMSHDYLRLVMGVLALLAAGFESFMLLTSNPFLILPKLPFDGADLNPLLQDPGMVSHPPMLYIGYVGFAVTYACAIAGMLSTQDRVHWSSWTRPWLLWAWAFLTIGIILGSAWAYRELGWGGWWFWDPVENASFMPWLVGTALLHTLMLTKRQPQFSHWAALLAIFGFVLSLLGTFLVRSGILISVHSFAVDPSRGIYLLGFLALVLILSLILLFMTYQRQQTLSMFAWHSKPKLLLLNNVLFMVAMLIVLLGTLFPIVFQFLTQEPLSIGPPYFNAILWPVTILLMILMGLAVQGNWFELGWQWSKQLMVMAAALIFGSLTCYLYAGKIQSTALIAWTLIYWLVLMHREHLFSSKVAKLPMLMAHFGFLISIIGITMTSQFSEEYLLNLRLGETVKHHGSEVKWAQAATYQGDNFWAMKLFIKMKTPKGRVLDFTPEYRVYTASKTPLPHASIVPFVWGDYYMNVGQSVGDGVWLIRWQFKPFVRWIWFGGIMMAIGGFLASRRWKYNA